MTSTPIPPGSVIFVGADDPNDTENTLQAWLVRPNDANTDIEWTSLGGGFVADSPADFEWLVKSCAEFHMLPVEYSDDVKHIFVKHYEGQTESEED